MTAKTLSMESLIQNSIRVYDGMPSVGFAGSTEITKNRTYGLEKFNGCYATNNSVICFVSDNMVYATPRNMTKERSLKNAGFREESFFVPFSNGDHPTGYENEWKWLRAHARSCY